MSKCYTHEKYGSFDVKRLDSLIKSVEAILSDARSMQAGIEQDLPDLFWFGAFSESVHDASTNTVSVEWPNLGIDLEDLEKILDGTRP